MMIHDQTCAFMTLFHFEWHIGVPASRQPGISCPWAVHLLGTCRVPIISASIWCFSETLGLLQNSAVQLSLELPSYSKTVWGVLAMEAPVGGPEEPSLMRPCRPPKLRKECLTLQSLRKKSLQLLCWVHVSVYQ
jgi:hypothetical protein